MTEYHRSKGFVIAKKDFREADQVFSVFTKDFGKIEILGKGIRKIKSKLRPGIDVFYFSEVEFIQARAHKTLTDANAFEKFKAIRNDLDKLRIAYRMGETADILIRGQEKDDNIYDLLKDCFVRLNNCKSQCELIYLYFFWNLASILGYGMDLHNCVLCNKRLLPETLHFEPENGGVACSDCGKFPESEILPDALKVIRIFLKKDWPVILKLKAEKECIDSLDMASQKYFSHLESFSHCA